MKHVLRFCLSLTLALVMLLSLSVMAFANGSVSYEGQARKFVFAPGSSYSPTDLFDSFKDVLPGDHLMQTIEIRNNASDAPDRVKIYLRALGAETGSEDFLSQLTLTVRENESELFLAPADQSDGLTDWVLIGTLEKGGKAVLDVMLDVPLTMDNEFQNAIGYLDWQFKVEELPAGKTGSATIAKAPKTGDDSNVVLWGCLLCLSVAGIVVASVTRKKHVAKK